MKLTTRTLAGLFLLCGLSGCSEQTVEESVTLADYERAAQHMYPHMANLVYDKVEVGKWAGDSLFTYMKHIPGGREFISVDPKTGTKAPAFNHRQLAMALSKVSGKEVSMDSLPFRTYSIAEGGDILFSALRLSRADEHHQDR